MERTALGAETVPVSVVPAGPGRDDQKISTRRQRLKEATSEAHRCLDHSLMKQGYFTNAAGFVLYLRRMHTFQLAFDDAAAVVDRDWYGAWGLHHHRGWIETDLLQAGIPRDALPAIVPQGGLHIVDRSSLAGALYVLAGSSLGARVLHRLSVERQLPGPSGSYYLSRLAASMRWSEFIKFLEDAEIASEDSMIDGAISTFTCVSNHLNGAVPK